MNKRIIALILGIIPLILLFVFDAYAWPEDTAKTGKACIYCHVNESGVGPLTPAGKYYAEKGTLDGWDESMADQYSDEEMFSKIDLGARVVTQYQFEDNGTSSFSIKTAKLSGNYALDDHFSVYMENNLGEFRRAYLYWDHYNLSATLGLQETRFGLRITDHSSLVEDEIGFGVDRIDIGLLGNARFGFVSAFGGFYNGSYPKPFRTDPLGATAFSAGIDLSPFDFISVGVHGYHNKKDVGMKERTLMAALMELHYGRFLYRGEHILGRYQGKLIRAYYSGLFYTPGDKWTFYGNGEMYDSDRDYEETATYRSQLGLSYALTPKIDFTADYTYYWQPDDEYGRGDLYIKAEF